MLLKIRIYYFEISWYFGRNFLRSPVRINFFSVQRDWNCWIKKTKLAIKCRKKWWCRFWAKMGKLPRMTFYYHFWWSFYRMGWRIYLMYFCLFYKVKARPKNEFYSKSPFLSKIDAFFWLFFKRLRLKINLEFSRTKLKFVFYF